MNQNEWNTIEGKENGVQKCMGTTPRSGPIDLPYLINICFVKVSLPD